VAKIGQNWPKLAKIGQNWPIFELFRQFFTFFMSWNTPETVLNEYNKKMVNFCHFSHILWSRNHVLKKVGRTRARDLFKFWYVLNLHALGYPKSVTKKICAHFWVTKSLSMMWTFYIISKTIPILYNSSVSKKNNSFVCLISFCSPNVWLQPSHSNSWVMLIHQKQQPKGLVALFKHPPLGNDVYYYGYTYETIVTSQCEQDLLGALQIVFVITWYFHTCIS
jgi:hypothetical protein